MGRGTHRGFITYEELNKSLGKRNLSNENLEQAFIHILEENIVLVEKKSNFKVLKKKDSSAKEEGQTIEKSDDPIRMYLREMGGVELLSREGEIAIAKRIEAGKDVMLIALSQSPITAQQFYEWNQQLQKDEILVREIIDIDTNYMEDETTGPSAKQKNAGETDGDDNANEDNDEDFNPTLAAMETEIKPKVLKRNNKLNAQKKINGVSVDIIKLPNEAAGVNIQIKAAILPALELKAICPHFHKTIEVRKWKIGAQSLIAHSALPNMLVEKAIDQAIRGGFVK